MNKDELTRKIRDCFVAYGVDEASISTMPDIIEDIWELIGEETDAAFRRGVEEGMA